jgi:hypothetical protein
MGDTAKRSRKRDLIKDPKEQDSDTPTTNETSKRVKKNLDNNNNEEDIDIDDDNNNNNNNNNNNKEDKAKESNVLYSRLSDLFPPEISALNHSADSEQARESKEAREAKEKEIKEAQEECKYNMQKMTQMLKIYNDGVPYTILSPKWIEDFVQILNQTSNKAKTLPRKRSVSDNFFARLLNLHEPSIIEQLVDLYRAVNVCILGSIADGKALDPPQCAKAWLKCKMLSD